MLSAFQEKTSRLLHVSMAKIQRKLLAASFGVSCASLVLCIVSLSTDNWLEATAVLTTSLRSNVNYGLFGGTLQRHQLAATLQFDLVVTCDFDVATAACIYSCQRENSQRQDELQRILAGRELEPCEQPRFADKLSYGTDLIGAKAIRPLRANNNKSQSGTQHIAAGLWFSTVLFLSLSLALTTAAVGFGLLNLYANPIERIFNIFGLFIWNGAAALFGTLALSLWAVLFQLQLQHNIAVTDTLRQELRFSSEDRARLGASYGALVAACLLDVTNVLLLFVRRQRMRRVPKPVLVADQALDTRLEFY